MKIIKADEVCYLQTAELMEIRRLRLEAASSSEPLWFGRLAGAPGGTPATTLRAGWLAYALACARPDRGAHEASRSEPLWFGLLAQTLCAIATSLL